MVSAITLSRTKSLMRIHKLKFVDTVEDATPIWRTPIGLPLVIQLIDMGAHDTEVTVRDSDAKAFDLLFSDDIEMISDGEYSAIITWNTDEEEDKTVYTVIRLLS